MEVRFHNSPKEVSQMNTQQLRDNFVVENLMVDDKIQLVYSHYDRVIVGGARPVQQTLTLEAHPELRADYFLERRELGVINIGGDGVVEADGESFQLSKLDGLYLGKGTKSVTFRSNDASQPAVFYLLSSPAHQTYPNRKLAKDEASPLTIGDPLTSNHRTVYKYIHLEGLKSCQLVMGLTVLKQGSVWNTMPSHVHTRRMEVYLYFDIAEDQRVFHFMGEPSETRHMLLANQQAIISPPWSIHSGCGTANYSFIWGMAGENLVYQDMDVVDIRNLR
ncbi:5-dehydro-4-deoxy-D-glucuronate isomerase [Paraflavisolibacter sp. H34]|uniref:5-dehydro-4-deoxy-D-glucuronate isomerase n=1 Tax=Huijunlia imazamoxiresistens TaxID=3127457 RepID=UPI00301A7A6C